MKIYESAVRKPISTILLFVGVMVFGLFSLMNLAVDQYPEIEIPQISVITMYPGANAADIETNITRVLEDNLNTVSNLKKLTSKSQDNVSMITVEFEYGSDLNEGANEIRDVVSRVQSQLPDDIDYPTIFKFSTSMIPVMMLAVTAEESYPALNKILDDKLVNVLNRVDGVGAVSIIGAPEREVQVNVDPAKLEAYNLTVEQLGQIIAAENVNIPSGTIDVGNNTFNIKADGEFKLSDEMRKVVVSNAGGRTVRLSDVAQIRDTLEKATMDERVNGQRGVRVMFQKQSGANTVNIVHEIQSRLPEIQKTLPKDVKMELIFEGSQEITDAIGSLSETILYAFIFVVLVVMAFLGRWRATLIICMTIPVSLICSFIYLFATGSTLNIISLSSLSIAIGMVVDDAIVVLENVERLMRTEKLSPFDASIKAMQEVSGALVAIVLVLSAVFIPVAFLGGIAGELYRQFAVTVSVSVVISGFVALTLTPALCAILLKDTNEKPLAFFVWFNKGLARFTVRFLQLVRLALKHRILSAILLVLTCAGAWQLLERTPTSFVPREDQGIVRMAIQLPEGSAFPRTEEVAEGFLAKIQKLPGVSNVVTMMGFDTLGSDIRANAATFILQLKNWSERTMTADDYQQELSKWLRESPDARGVAVLPAAIPGLGSSNGFSGYVTAHGSDNPLLLQEVTDGFIEELSKRPELTGLRSSLVADSPQLMLHVDRDRAYALGVDVDDVYNTISALLASDYINDFTRNGKTYRVVMQADAQFRSLPSDIGRASVRSSSGKMVPISTMISLERVSAAESLARMNGYLGAPIMGAAVQGLSSGDAIRIVEETAREYLPPGYQVEWTGQAFHEKRIGASSATAFGFGLLVMFLILAALYERWSLPIAVVLAVPYAFLGAMTAIWLRGTANDIYFQIGLLVLIGLTAKNAILIVEFAAQKMEEEGKGPFEAAIEAAGLRLRPILMTSLAFILGVLPMVTATGASAAARHSMGTGVCGGMLAATFISTIFVPVFFTWFARKRKKAVSAQN